MHYRAKVWAEADERPYLQRYAGASEVAEFCVDVLRLVRCKEDIGVPALEIVELDSLTPKYVRLGPIVTNQIWHAINRTDSTSAHPSTVGLTGAELERLRGAISSLLGVRGVTSKV